MLHGPDLSLAPHRLDLAPHAVPLQDRLHVGSGIGPNGTVPEPVDRAVLGAA